MDTLTILAVNNSWEYNHLKAVEELTELAEVLIKKINKQGGIKEPKNKEVIDEIGDVLIRVEILRRMYGPASVDSRVDAKITFFDDCLSTGKYKGKL